MTRFDQKRCMLKIKTREWNNHMKCQSVEKIEGKRYNIKMYKIYYEFNKSFIINHLSIKIFY